MNKYGTPSYLSPSALSIWETSPDEAFIRYIVPKEIRPERDGQTMPMAGGSAFDALVKAEISEHFIGRELTRQTGYNRCHLVEQQCDQAMLPDALEVACVAFDQYVRCGAYDNLIELIRHSCIPPRMEFDVTKTVGGVPLLGKPDLVFPVNGCNIICDWKLSGCVSIHGVSPQQGYQLAIDCHESRTHGKAHKKYVPTTHLSGVEVNAVPMNETTDYFADQLATYAWCLEEPVGSTDFVVRIEQLACRTSKAGELRVKCVVHQSTVDSDYQVDLLERYQRCWSGIADGHYFQDMTRSQSDARANMIIMKLENPILDPSLAIGITPFIDWN